MNNNNNNNNKKMDAKKNVKKYILRKQIFTKK